LLLSVPPAPAAGNRADGSMANSHPRSNFALRKFTFSQQPANFVD
jgi:hypothetical protein